MTVQGDRFHHPYEPYDIQLQLMNSIYDTIDKGYKVGLFESPTGTGKTLSLICSTMTWIRNHKKNPPVQDQDHSDSDDEPDWVKESYKTNILGRYKKNLKDYEIHLNEVSKQYEAKTAKVKQLPEKRMKMMKAEDDNEFVPDDYVSDTETVTNRNEQLKDEISRLLTKIGGGTSKKIDMDMLQDNEVKILFSSRTHTQLTQFSHQLNLTSFESSFDDLAERTKYLPLGSRKQLCIHPKVSKLRSTEAINDSCKEKVNTHSCDFLNNTKDEDIRQQFNDYSLTKVHDIEDLKSLGEDLKVCPYFTVRHNVKVSEVVSLPYQMLLEENTREVLSLNIENSIIIIDEAHNLLDTINALNSVSISLNELNTLHKSLKTYLSKFSRRLNSGNRINLMKLIKICGIFRDFVSKSESSAKSGAKVDINEVFSNNTGDLFNIHKLNTYLKKSKIAFKIENYLEKTFEEHHSTSNPLLFKLTNFLKSISNPSGEGDFFWNCDSGISINYMLLDPSEIFRPIVEQCKCLILAGGTMEPMNDYTDFLFPYLSGEKINKFSCDHIIPSDNLKTVPIGSYNQQVLDFSFKNRNSPDLLRNLGLCLLDITKRVPDGVVVFFPSYKYLQHIVDQWKKTGIFEKLQQCKGGLLVETNSNESVNILEEYSNTVQQGKGAILLSVVGGKLSEGINFSDELARAVIMVGLPYPNVMSSELIAKRKFIYDKTLARTGSTEAAAEASKQFIENICMRSVNQSIGRSIRHINDYSMIYLLDSRYRQAPIQNKLSGWIRKRILNNLSFHDIMNHTDDFFVCKSIGKLT